MSNDNSTATAPARGVKLPRRTVPRRAGTVAARFVDPATSLPNRVALMTEMHYGLMNYPFWLAMVVVEINPPNFLDEGIDGDSRAVAAAARRLREAVRPSDMVGRLGDRIVGAVLWGWEQGDPAHAVEDRIRRSFARPMKLQDARPNDPISFQVGLGLARPTQTPTIALTTAWTALRAAPVTIPGRSAGG